MIANWQLGNGTEIIGESGVAYFDSNGDTSIPIDFITGGWLDVIPVTPWWMTLSPGTIRIDLYPHLWKVVQIQQQTTTMRTHKSMMAVAPMTIHNWCLSKSPAMRIGKF